MSIWAERWACDQTVGSTGAKFVLVSLARFADEQGRCYPSQQTISDLTEQDERTVRRHLAALEEKGLIKRQERRRSDGTRTSDLFFLQGPAEAFKPAVKSSGGTSGQNDRNNRTKTAEPPDKLSGELISENNQKEERRINPPNHADVDSTVWADAPWLLKFLQDQATFNGTRLPRLLNHDYWSDLSEAINGLEESFLRSEFAKMAIWLRDNRSRAPTEKGVRRFVATWLEKAAENRRRKANAGNQNSRH